MNTIVEDTATLPISVVVGWAAGLTSRERLRKSATASRQTAGLPSFTAASAPASVKTCYLYGMRQRLVNVRLDEERLRKARKLRASGVVLSDLVRQAIDEKFDQVSGSRPPRDLEALMARIFEQYPDPPDLPALRYDVYDRTEARDAIRRKLRGRRR